MEFLNSVITEFKAGGIWMWVILALQLATIYIIVERTLVLFRKMKPNQGEIADSFEEDIRRGQIQNVFQRAKALESESALARTVAAGAQAAMNLGGRDEIQGKMDEVLLKENAAVEKRTPFLATFANVATLTGLLGTITGMIKSFAAVSTAVGAERATSLANGIAEAMNTTAYGLIVAIPGLLMYAVLQNRVSVIQEDLNQSALKTFNLLSYTYNPIGIRPQQKGATTPTQLDA